jgi:predicted nucleic acid-binding protein
MLVDTDVIIWNLRGLQQATQRLDQLHTFTISATTWLELLQGFRNRAEMLAVQKSLEKRNANRLPITPAITERAITLMENIAPSHGLQLGDALIAATAIEHKLTLLTGNVKHFSAIPELTIERFEP